MGDRCNAPCPGSSRVCTRRAHGENEEHRTTLTPRRTYVYWIGDSYPVRSRYLHTGWLDGDAPPIDMEERSEG